MKSTRLEQLRKKLLRNNQKGFTLIELLVVVSILGILAAVVTMSLVGIETRARDNAQATELATVQAAFDTDVHENGLNATNACTALSGGKTIPQMTDWPGSGAAALEGNYLRQSNGQFHYTCKDPTSATLQNN